MFSEALKIMDRNTTKYMVDVLHEELNSTIQTLEEVKQEADSLTPVPNSLLHMR